MAKESDESLIRRMFHVVPCSVKGCRFNGDWVPILTFNQEEGDKKPEAELDLPICEHHKNTLDVTTFMVQEFMAQVETALKSAGLKLPPRNMIELSWRRRLPIIELEK